MKTARVSLGSDKSAYYSVDLLHLTCLDEEEIFQ